MKTKMKLSLSLFTVAAGLAACGDSVLFDHGGAAAPCGAVGAPPPPPLPGNGYPSANGGIGVSAGAYPQLPYGSSGNYPNQQNQQAAYPNQPVSPNQAQAYPNQSPGTANGSLPTGYAQNGIPLQNAGNVNGNFNGSVPPPTAAPPSASSKCTPNGQNPGYANGALNGQNLQQGQVQQGMTFTLDPDDALSNDDVAQALFPGQISDPYQLQNSSAKATMTMTMQSKDTSSDPPENWVDMQVTLTLKLNDGTSLQRKLVSADLITLHASSDKDIMDGALKASDGSKGRINITATRDSSTTQQAALQHPWTGKLMIERDGKNVRLGRFTGIGDPTPSQQ